MYTAQYGFGEIGRAIDGRTAARSYRAMLSAKPSEQFTYMSTPPCLHDLQKQKNKKVQSTILMPP